MTRIAWSIVISLFVCVSNAVAATASNNIVCRDDFSSTHRDELTSKLRQITGWPELEFDRDGALVIGAGNVDGGSKSARALVRSVVHGTNVVILEDASERSDVAFSRVVRGEWKNRDGMKPPAYVVLIDFADFEQVMGDRLAVSAFNVGWGLLHELDHVANDSTDTAVLGEPGNCEDHINVMRHECNLPQRTDYFFTFFPLNNDDAFMTRFVRLAFEQEDLKKNKKKRYWLIWDANLVGGLDQRQQIASFR